MTKFMYPSLALGVFLSSAVIATARQDDDNTPPTINSVSWQISRNLNGDPEGLFGPFQSFNPAVDRAQELDLLEFTITLSDPDLPDDEIFVARNAFGFPLAQFTAPEAPPIVEDDETFQGPFSTVAGTTIVLVGRLNIPPFLGKNQARLRGIIDWDVRWINQFMASNESAPEDFAPGTVVACGGLIDEVFFWCDDLHALENPALAPPNAPPFADAGRDIVVAAGTTVELDGSETFDSFNLGFDGGSVDVFEKDRLQFAWEWTSGPERVIPIVRDAENRPAVAEVTLNEFGTYIYRLIADDGVNALPSTDSLVIEVVANIPENRGPVAAASGPTQPVAVGVAITLDGTRSFDPDGDPLGFLWQQTDELGGRIPSSDIRRFFQPLSGIDTPVSRWQATKTGIFHFRLLVNDGEFVDSTRISIEVVDTQTAGFVVVQSGAASPDGSADVGDSAESTAQPTPNQIAPLCGVGLFPLAFAPLALFFMRGNRRR